MSNTTGLESRAAALELLSHVLDKRQPLETQGLAHLPPQDRAFATRMAKTTLKRLGQVDALLAGFMHKPLPPALIGVQHVLRLGVAQLLWMDIAPHAAVNLSVEMVKEKFPAQSGLVNAVLKRVAAEGRALAEAQDISLNTPEWLWQSWVEAYGESAARAWAESHLAEPPLDISVKENAAEWAEKLGGELLEGGTIRLHDAADIAQLSGFAEGAWWVQDASAAQPVKMLAAAMGSLAGKRIIDLCAAPGGKTAQLAAMGAQVTAIDISENRLRTLRENLSRLKLEAEVIAVDALKWQPQTPPDAILLDAPCSATGTLKRHPDVAYLRTPKDIARLCNTQARLLRHALEILPGGGFLAYSVCSLQPEEGEPHIRQLLEEHKNVKLISQSLPGNGDGDGFYVGVMRKG